MSIQRKKGFGLTDEELWDGKKGEERVLYVPIKKEMLQEPLFLRSRHSGVDLDSPKNEKAPN